MRQKKFLKSDRTILALLPFAFLVGFMAIYSEVFKIPEHPITEFELTNPFLNKDFSNAESISIKNRKGEFNLVNFTYESDIKTQNMQKEWILDGAKKFPANPEVIEKIFLLLRNLKIKRKLSSQDITLGNFSFQNPLVSLQVKLSNSELIRMDIGLINSIDHSAYITFQSPENVYQIEMPSLPLESWEAQAFAEKEIFPSNLDQVSELYLSKGKQQRISALLHLKRENGLWVDQNQRELSSVKVAEFLAKIFSQKGIFVASRLLTNIKNDEARLIKNALNNPLFILTLKLNNGHELVYTISNSGAFVNQSPLEKGQQVVVAPTSSLHEKAEDKELVPVIVSKHLLQILNIQSNDFLTES